MTSMPASRSARATTFTPRSWPSRPTLASKTRIGALMFPSLVSIPGRLLYTVYRFDRDRQPGSAAKDAFVEFLASPKTLVEQVYEVILDAICAGTLKPGERLTQDGVAKRLNVSRQPIHNALLVLKAQGFVHEAGRRGLSVALLDAKFFDAIYQFRSAVEPLAVSLAVAHVDQRAAQKGRAL